MALVDEARLALRISGHAYDNEIQLLVDAAVEDMKRVGIDPAYVTPPSGDMPALVRNAIVCYVKGHFGYDNDEASRFLNSYRQMVCDLLNSEHNKAAGQ